MPFGGSTALLTFVTLLTACTSVTVAQSAPSATATPTTLPPGVTFPAIPRFYYCLPVLSEINKVDGVEQSFYVDGQLTCYYQEPFLAGQFPAGTPPFFPSPAQVDSTLVSLAVLFEPIFQNQRDLRITSEKRYVFLFPPPALEPEVSRGLPHPTYPLATTPWIGYTARMSGLFKASMKLHDFPYDEQVLWINVTNFIEASGGQFAGAWKPGFDPVASVDDVIGWRIDGSQTTSSNYIDTSTGANLPSFSVGVTLKRQPQYYVNKIIFGVALLTIMAQLTYVMNARDTNRPIGAMTAFLGIVTYLFVISTDVPKVAYLTRMDRFVNLSFYFVFGAFVMHLLLYFLVTYADEAEAKAAAKDAARQKKEDDYRLGRTASSARGNPIAVAGEKQHDRGDAQLNEDDDDAGGGLGSGPPLATVRVNEPAADDAEPPAPWWDRLRRIVRWLDFIFMFASLIAYGIAVMAILDGTA